MAQAGLLASGSPDDSLLPVPDPPTAKRADISTVMLDPIRRYTPP